MLNDSLDRAVLTAGIPAFENDQHPVTVLDDVPLNLDKLYLQGAQRGAIALTSIGICGSPVT
jgi:hypothetical protein